MNDNRNPFMSKTVAKVGCIVFVLLVAAIVAALLVKTAGAAIDQYPYPAPEPTGAVGINEISWAGTTASSSDEWFELVVANPEVNSVNLAGWTIMITKTDGVTSTIVLPNVTIANTMNEIGYHLFERTDDMAVSTVTATAAYAGSLPNTDLLEIALLYPNGEVSDKVVMVDGDWPAGSSAPRASMQKVQDPETFEVVWMTSNTGTELDADGNVILGTPGGVNVAPIANPTTCGPLPNKVAYDLDLVVLEDLSTTGRITLDADLWAVDENNSLVSTDGTVVFEWIYTQHQWEVTDFQYDDGTTNDCIDALEMLKDAAENILNGQPSNTGADPLPAYWQKFAMFLNGVLQFQKSGLFGSYLPVVVTE